MGGPRSSGTYIDEYPHYKAIGKLFSADTLSHHGVKGMKWGVVRANPSGSGSAPQASEDSKAASAANEKAKKAGTTKVLTNKELQTAITRMNLESQYNNLKGQKKSDLDRGQAAVKKVLGVGKTIEEVRNFLETPTGKFVKNGLKGAFLAAKIATAAQTGGASAAAGAAASAGVGLAVRRYNERR